MNRLFSKPGLRIDRIDFLMLSAILTIAGSYFLGYKLDWRQTEDWVAATASEGNEEEPADDGQESEGEDAEPAALSEVKPAVVKAGGAFPSWDRPPRERAWDEMTGELQRQAGRHHGRVAIYLKDLKTEKTWTYHADELYPSASLIKVPILAGVFQRIQEGRLALSDRLVLRRRHRVGGSGSLKWRPDGSRLTVKELMQHMISESDNTATAILIDALGLGYLQQSFARMGLLYTGIYREGMSIRGGRVTHENYTTAREMAMLLEKIYRGELVDKPSSELMLDILRHRRSVKSRLAKGLPVGWEIAHKTGLLRRACHDSAVIFSPDGDYVMVVLTGQNRDYRSAKDFISRLGKVTFRHYKGETQYLAKAGRRQGSLALR